MSPPAQRLAAALALACALGGAACAPTLAPGIARIEELRPAAGVHATRRVVLYDVPGTNARDLRAAMNRVGPLDGGDRRTDAATNTFVRWRYGDVVQGGACSVADVRVELQITFFLPSWSPPSGALAADVERWRRYTSALMAHERTHEQIGVEAAVQIADALRAVPAQPTCSELESVADRAAKTAYEGMGARNVEFDRVTRHGATQGAVFP